MPRARSGQQRPPPPAPLKGPPPRPGAPSELRAADSAAIDAAEPRLLRGSALGFAQAAMPAAADWTGSAPALHGSASSAQALDVGAMGCQTGQTPSETLGAWDIGLDGSPLFEPPCDDGSSILNPFGVGVEVPFERMLPFGSMDRWMD